MAPPPDGIAAPGSNRGWLSQTLRRIFSFHVLLAALLAAIVFWFARGAISDPDIWWHLRNAETLMTSHHFVRFDSYSFTVSGHPWINTEWLAEVPYYLAWKVSGLTGIVGLSILLLEAILLGLLYLCWRESGNIKASAIACYFAVFLCTVSFGPRMILFGYGYMILLLIILQCARLNGKAPLWCLPLLFCLWANSHGSWLLGLIVFAIEIAAGMVEGHWGKIRAVRWNPPELRRLWITFSLSVAALFVNPYGYHLVFYPFDMAFIQKLNISHVAEWVSVNFHDARGKVALILIVALLLGALLRKHEWKLYEVGLVLFGLYCGLTYIRFLFLAALLIAPLLAKFLDVVPPYRPEIDKPVLNAVLIFGILAFIIRGSPSARDLHKSVEADYPAEILPYLKTHPPDGPMLNFYLWGGYLGWEDRNLKSFIDSRVDIFEYAGVLKEYLDLVDLKKPKAVLDQYHIRYVLFPPQTFLAQFLSNDPDWKVIHKGKISVLYERVGQVPAAQIPGSAPQQP